MPNETALAKRRLVVVSPLSKPLCFPFLLKLEDIQNLEMMSEDLFTW